MASDFVNLLKSEADGEQLVLLTDGPYAGKAEALAQPEHGLKALDSAPGRVERAKATDPGQARRKTWNRPQERREPPRFQTSLTF